MTTTTTDDPTAEVPVAVVALGRRPNWWRRRRRFVTWLAALFMAAAGAGGGLWLSGTIRGAPSPSPRVVRTVLVAASTGTITETVTAHGTIQPAQVADLNFAVSGQVAAVDVRVGQPVTAGQVLAAVAPTALQATQASAKAALAAAQAKVAQDSATRAPASQVSADQAAVVAAQAALTTATKSLQEAALTSPIAGIVSTLSLFVGEQVSGTGTPGVAAPGATLPPPSQTTGTPLPPADQVTVVSSNRFVVVTTVDDTQVGKLKVGNQVLISPASSGQSGSPSGNSPLQGTVATVGLVPNTGTGIPAFPVTIDVIGTPRGVYAGSGAQLSIVVRKLTGVVEVPTPAISYRGGAAAVVVVGPGDRHVRQSVTVGSTSGGMTQVLRGLLPGQKVVERVITAPGNGGTERSGGHAQNQTTGQPGGSQSH